MRLRTALLLAAAAATVSACASKPKTPLAGGAPSEPPVAEGRPQAGGDPIEQGNLTAQQDLAAKAGDRVYFALDSHELDDASQAVLQRQAAWLAANPSVQAQIAGNADERGTREYNLALGARRATSVRQFLIARGVSPARLATISYGKERPIDAGSGEEAWARNRNAHTVVIGVADR